MGGDCVDVKKRLQALVDAKGWTLYRLSKESGVAWSTVRNMFQRDTMPTTPTLQALCNSLEIGIDELFYDEERASLSDEHRNLLTQWDRLSKENQELVMALMNSLNRK